MLRDPELRERLAADGAGINGGSFAEAAAHGKLLVLAVLGDAAEQARRRWPREFRRQGRDRCHEPLDFSGGFPPQLRVNAFNSTRKP